MNIKEPVGRETASIEDSSEERRPKPVPYDPELVATVEQYAEVTQAVTSSAEALAAVRSAQDAAAPEPDLKGGRLESLAFSVPGPPGGPEVPLSVFRRAEGAGKTGRGTRPAPLLYFMHGGGMIMGNRFTGVSGFLDWLDEVDLVVATVEYRLAPEHPHPDPVEDCYAGLAWCAANADRLGADPSKIVLAGISAGGGLAAATSILARDRGGPAAAAQLLMCPMLDDRNDTPSAHQYSGIGVWDRGANAFGWRALLGGDAGAPEVSPYAAPARLKDFSGLPPAFIDVGAAEVFRDEAVAYASGLWAAGVQAELHVWAGGSHAFAGMVPEAAVSVQARGAYLPWLKRTLGL